MIRPGIISLALSALAAFSTASAADGNVTDLELVTVYTQHLGASSSIGGTTLTRDTLQLFNRDTLDQALVLAPGVSLSMLGARNETDVWIRGNDRWRVPLYQDGIPVYLPVDNRIDFGRFSTVDVAAIQVAKGFASLIDGPGAIGGSINIVSRVVERPLEADARLGATFDSQGSHAGTAADLFVGTRQSNWFVQAAGSFDRQDHFRLSDSFTPGTFQGPGDRIDSFHRDYKINLKAGFAPTAGAEYSLNYIDQVGKKDNTPPDSLIPPKALGQVKFWTWPSWDKKSLYWLSKNTVDEAGSFVKTRLYYDRFYNQLDSFDNITYTTQKLPKSFDSTYDDRAAGGSVELDKVLAGGADTLRFAGHYRWDEHKETQSTRNAPGAPWYQQPWEKAQETTWSLAFENIWVPANDWQVILGTSYDARHLIGDSQWVASGITPPFGYSFSYPVSDKHALNGELAVVYTYRPDGSIHLSYADRARFPTLFEMYSTRFNTFVNNPDLKPERAHYGQIGITDTFGGTRVTVNAFLAKIADAIVAVPLSATRSENQNAGSERQSGFEIELSRQLLSSLSGGLNYSNLTRDILDGNTVPTDTPDHRLFAFLDWQPLPALELVPSVDVQGRRWLQSAINNTIYYRGGAYTLVNFKIAYQPTSVLRFEAGATNLTDRNYLIEDGYHGPGREYFVMIRATL